MKKHKGIIRDIRTGRAIGKTDSLTDTFVGQINSLVFREIEFYIVHGRVQHLEVRNMLDVMKESFIVIYDPRISTDVVYIFEGDPAELGFTA